MEWRGLGSKPMTAHPETHNEIQSAKIKSLVDLFAAHNSRDLIRNLDIEMSALTIAGLELPQSRSHSGIRGNCYICCPSTAYIDYAIDETRNFSKHPLLKSVLSWLIRCCSPLLKASGLDDQLQPNNWLFSTNPVPQLDEVRVRSIIERLTNDYPTSAIIIRSLNEITDQHSMRCLEAQGFRLLATRQIYMFRGPSADGNHRRTINRDARMREKNGYVIVRNNQFEPADFVRCEILYNLLYLEKYSPLNPHYTAVFFQEMHQRGLIEFSGVRNSEGILDAVSGIFVNNNTMTQPFVGYDTKLPQAHGLDRIAMSFGFEYALASSKIYNLSSGAASFKRNRGGEPAIEYMAVYHRHLHLRRRMATAAIQKILKTIGVPIMRRFEL